MKKLVLLFLFINCNLFGQKNDQVGINDIIKNLSEKNKYLNFLLLPDSSSQNHLLTASYQYLHITNYTSFRTGGFILSGGLNLARFVSKKNVFGICFDIKGIKGFTNQKFSSEFVNDFNSNFITSYNDQHDSIRTNVVKCKPPSFRSAYLTTN